MPLTKQSFHALFDASPNPYLVLDRQLTIVTANRAYLASTGRDLPGMAGRPFQDAFPSDPDTLRQMSASLERAIRSGESDTMALLRYDIPRPEIDGGFETRFWSITHTPVFDDAGDVEFVMQHPIDVTEVERMRGAARSEGEGELLAARSGLFSRAQHVYQQNLTLQADVERLNDLFQQAPSFMAVLRGPEHVYELVNEAVLELMGERPYLGTPVRAAAPELEGQGFFEILDRVYASGDAFVGRGMPARLRRNGQLEQRYLDFIYQPITGSAGTVEGVFVEGTDVTEQVLALAEVEEKVTRLESAERQLAFQLELADSLRPLTSAEDITATASAVLGRRLGVARVLFADVDPASMGLAVRGDWSHPEMASLTGQDLQLAQLGCGMESELLAGRPVLVDDAALAGCAADDSFGASAYLTVPVIEAGMLRAVLSLHRPAPHHWTGEELRMAQDMAERTWAAVDAANAQRTLRAERDASQTIFDSMTEGFGLLAHDWRLVKMNAAGLTLLGLGEEVLGTHLRDAFAQLSGTAVEDLCRRVKDSGVADIGEYPHPQPGAGVRWLEMRAFPALGGGVALFLRDVTVRRDAQEQLRDTAERLHFILESAQLGAWEMDLATGISRRALLHDQCFGYTAPVADWNVARFLEHVHPEDRAEVQAQFEEAIAHNRVWQTECRVLWPDGTLHWLAIFGAMHAAAEGPGRIAGIVFDISERKQAEEKLRIEGRRKDEFLAMLAHELRNPLAPIGAAAQILALGVPDAEKVRKTSAIITRQVAHITSLIDDLLDVSRVSGGLVRLDNAPVDVKDAVADAVEQVRPLVEARGHRLEVHLAAEHTVVQGDRKRLVQVLSNLLNNAAKYTPQHGRIVMHMEIKGDEVVLCVSDNGIGMTPDVQAGVFDLFTQAERTPDRSQGGLGIGLALVRSLVELHGGRVSVHSDGLGRGSKFSVVLPRLHQAAAGDTRQAPQAGAGPAAPAPLRILVVDDNVDAAQLLAMFLDGVGYRVAVEHDPARALEAAAQENFDAFLLDIGLPGMDGIELARRLRALPQAHDALLIAITGYGSPQDREAALEAGFDHHFVKPAPLDKLLAIFAKLAPGRLRGAA